MEYASPPPLLSDSAGKKLLSSILLQASPVTLTLPKRVSLRQIPLQISHRRTPLQRPPVRKPLCEFGEVKDRSFHSRKAESQGNQQTRHARSRRGAVEAGQPQEVHRQYQAESLAAAARMKTNQERSTTGARDKLRTHLRSSRF